MAQKPVSYWAGRRRYAIVYQPSTKQVFHAEEMLPKEAVEEFKRLYRKRFGRKLSDAEATRRANNLVNLYKAVCQSASFGLVNVKEKPQGKSDQQ